MSPTPEPTPTPEKKPTTLGAKPHWKQSWGTGQKSSTSNLDHFFAGGAGHPKDSEVTAEDVLKFIEMARERHGGK